MIPNSKLSPQQKIPNSSDDEEPSLTLSSSHNVNKRDKQVDGTQAECVRKESQSNHSERKRYIQPRTFHLRALDWLSLCGSDSGNTSLSSQEEEEEDKKDDRIFLLGLRCVPISFGF